MTAPSPDRLAAALRRCCDIEALRKEHPALTREDVEAVLDQAAEDLARRAASRQRAEAVRADGGAGSIVVHTDGSSLGNPGSAGIGVVLLDANGGTVDEISEYIGEATNNVAEYRAAIAGLARARELGATDVRLRADSELLIKQLTGQYRVKNHTLKPLRAELKSLADSFDRFACEHVRREYNTRADELANLASGRT